MGKSIRSILCIEDDPDFCSLLTRLLPEFEVVSVDTKSAGMRRALNDKFSLIFLDRWLPDGTGDEVCRQIRSFDKRTPILFITAAQELSETYARSIGAQGVLKKASPTFFDDLQQRTADLALS
jgi:DNA-binding response OmpR family regulator